MAGLNSVTGLGIRWGLGTVSGCLLTGFEVTVAGSQGPDCNTAKERWLGVAFGWVGVHSKDPLRVSCLPCLEIG